MVYQGNSDRFGLILYKCVRTLNKPPYIVIYSICGNIFTGFAPKIRNGLPKLTQNILPCVFMLNINISQGFAVATTHSVIRLPF
jgi:hypothetical protein